MSDDGRLTDCIFCRIIARTADALIIHEDDRTISFLVLHPTVPGHTAVVPKMHCADIIYSIPEDVLASLISSCKMHALRWRERIGATGVNILNASGIDAEQSVFHFHFHLLPRFANDGYRTWPLLRGVGESREVGGELARLHDRVRACDDPNGWLDTPGSYDDPAPQLRALVARGAVAADEAAVFGGDDPVGSDRRRGR